jgi:hypothetical protein
MDPAAGGSGDPWDHPAILASIDDLCSAHYHTSNRTVIPSNPPSGTSTTPSLTKLFTHPSALNHAGFTEQVTLGGARLQDKGNKTVDSSVPQDGNPLGFRPLPGKLPLKTSLHKRRQKAWKPKTSHPKLTLGMDVGLSDACNLALCALVGRLAYKEKCKQSLDSWVTDHWYPLLGYTPQILLLQQGWMGFIFRKPEDTVLILERFWAYNEGSLMLKRWRMGFNPATEFFGLRHLWVLLPGLPLQLWNQQALEQIGSSIGRFLRQDPSTFSASDRKMARIYVEMDIQAGLPEILEIDWRNQLISQRLDYLGIPFRCSFCRRTGHLRKDCYKFPPPAVDLDPAEDPTFDGYISSPNQHEVVTIPSDDSVLGKIHRFCPSLYNTFTSWDRLYISEQIDFLSFAATPVTHPDKPDPLSHLPTPLPKPTELEPADNLHPPTHFITWLDSIEPIE